MEGGAVGRIRINELAATARDDSTVALEATAVVGDSVLIATALQGTAAGDTVRATLQRLDLVEGGRTRALEQPAARAPAADRDHRLPAIPRSDECCCSSTARWTATV